MSMSSFQVPFQEKIKLYAVLMLSGFLTALERELSKGSRTDELATAVMEVWMYSVSG